MKQFLAVFFLSVSLIGCKAITAPASAPTRNVGERITDVTIERRILSSLAGVQGLTSDNHRIAIDVFRGQVLLTGEVPSQEIMNNVVYAAATVDKVEVVHNRLKIQSEPKSQSHTLHENYLKSKLQAKLMRYEIKPTQYYITVRDDWAYLMGTLTKAQYDEIEEAARKTDGLLGLSSLAELMLTESEASDYYQSSQAYPNQAQDYSAPTTVPIGAPTAPAVEYSSSQGYQVPSTGYTIPTHPAQTGQSASPYVQMYQGTNQP